LKFIRGFISSLLFMLSLASMAQKPEQDCINAIPICKSLYSESKSYVGIGLNSKEVNPATSCLNGASGEVSSVWYTLTIQTGGKLNFVIIPNDPQDDYDWAVFNLTGKSCSSTFSDPGAEVSCNFSAWPGKTGATGGTNLSSQPPTGLPNNAEIDVQAGENYVILINNQANSTNGYTIDLTASTAQIFDNIPPKILGLNAFPACHDSVINVNFTENVLCNSVNLLDFALIGPGGPYRIMNISSTECGNGGAYDNSYTLNIRPGIEAGGSFYLKLLGPVNDLCQNQSSRDSINIVINSLALVGSQSAASCAGAKDAWAAVDISNSIGPFDYLWSEGSTTDSISGLGAGNYAVTVTDFRACPSILTYTIQTASSPMNVDVNMGSVKCNGGSDGWLAIDVVGPNSPFSFLWSNGNTADSISNLTAGSYSVLVMNASGCNASFDLDVSEPPLLKVSTYANNACNGSAVRFFASASGGTKPYNYSYTGDDGFNIPTAGDENVYHVYPDTGTYAYTVTAIDSNGCIGSQSGTARVIVKPEAAFSVLKMEDNVFSFSDSSLNASSIQWIFDDGDISFVDDPIHTYLKSGFYDVLLIASNKGCQDSATARVVAMNEIGFYIPNTFSPNGDGHNDTFGCYGTGIRAFKMSIYNRWGELIFLSGDVGNPWDGRLSNGMPAMSGVYDYVIEVYDSDGTSFDRRGGLFLMR
jgi:gliding motility-associated-like protein